MPRKICSEVPGERNSPFSNTEFAFISQKFVSFRVIDYVVFAMPYFVIFSQDDMIRMTDTVPPEASTFETEKLMLDKH